MKNGWTTIALLLVAVAVTGAGCAHTSGEVGKGETAKSGAATDSTQAAGGAATGAAVMAGAVTLPDGLKYEDLKVGEGPVAEDGMQVTVHYTGWLLDGTKFDSSLDRGEPFHFQLGHGNVIRGWDEGVKGMKVGGKRKLTIPPDLGYGAAGAGNTIPPNATLVFEVELLNVQ